MYDNPLNKKEQLRSDGTLPRTWEDTQISVFTKWVNTKLRERNMELENLGDGLKDGIKLINLVEILSGKDIGSPYNQKPKDVFQMVNNCDIAVNYIQKEMGIKLVAISGKDIVDKNTKCTLGLIWSLIAHCHLDAIMSEVKHEGQSSKDALLQWCKDSTAGYQNVNVVDFTKSWSSGCAFCALVNKYVPDVLNYGSLDLNNQSLCVKSALESLKKLGVNVYLDPSDIVGVQTPDEKAIITQVAEMYRFLTDKGKMDQARARLFKSQEINEAIGRMIRESQGQVRDTLFQMATNLRPLITEQHLQYCPLCEQLFRGLVGLYNLLRSATSPEEVAKAKADIQAAQNEIQRIQSENARVQQQQQQQYEQLKIENEQLKAQVNQHQQENQRQSQSSQQLQDEVQQLKEQLQKVQQEKEALLAKVEQDRNAQAEAQNNAQVAAKYESAKKNNKALEHLIAGLKYEYGHGVVKNDSLALFEYQCAADLSNPEAVFSLARMYDRGRGTREDPTQAALLYQKAADGNHYAAMNNLASLKLSGRGTQKDEQSAAQLFKVAADNGCSSAQCNYATLCDFGRGVPQNTAEAFRYLKMAADSRHPKAMNNLAYKYQNGIGSEKNAQEAQKLYALAANAGNTTAMFNQGVLMQNQTQAIPFWEKAANLGDRNALNNLGVARLDGLCGVPKDEAAGAQLIKAAADKQSPEAILNYSSLLLSSRGGVQQNVRGAMKILRAAAIMGQPSAMTNFAVELAQGNNVAKNMNEAVKYMRMASDKSDPLGCYNYGLMLNFGIGMEKNPREAQRYFKFALSRGIKEAEKYVEKNTRRTSY